MQKKLLAVAVAGALAAPALALAQSAVTVSGNINVWYEPSTGASGATNTCPTVGCTVSTFDVKNRDRVQDGSGSNIRFTAVEDIGSGLQGFAQIESAVINNADTRNNALGQGAATGGWGTRNSGVGLRGQAWGEVLIGIWDVHYNEQYGTDGLLIKAASHNSMLGLLNAFGTVGNMGAGGGLGGATIGARYSNVLRYQSPNWGGFSFRASYVRPTDAPVPTATSTATPNVTEGTKNKAYNFAPQFNMGGIHVGLSYLKDKDIVTAASPMFAGATVQNIANGGATTIPGATLGSATAGNLTTITSTRLFGAYSFPFGLKVGLVYDQSKLDVKSGGGLGDSQIKRSVWGIPLVYTIGAHTIAGSYAQASKWTGQLGTAGGNSISWSDVGVIASGSTSTAQSVGDNSKAKMYVVGYLYDLSKRTNIHVTYSQIKNDNLVGYDFFANGVGMTNGNFGADPRIISVGLRHAF